MQSQAFHTGRSPVPPLPPTLVRGTTLCLAALVSSAGDSLGVSRRKLPRHGPTRLHHDPAEAYMRPVLVTLRASASAFFASPFEEAAVISIDGFGDFSSVTPDSVNHRHLRKGCPAMGTPTSQNYGNRRRKARCTMREQL